MSEWPHVAELRTKHARNLAADKFCFPLIFGTSGIQGDLFRDRPFAVVCELLPTSAAFLSVSIAFRYALRVIVLSKDRAMQKLSLSQWASVAEIGGTVAVVISLLLVAISLERNTAAVSAENSDDLYDAFRQIELVVLNNSELANITIRGAADPDSLSEAETAIYKMWATQYLDLWERTLIREKDGLIQPGTLEGWDEWYGDWVIRHLTYQR
jgi:hypothetical protein